VAPLSQGRTAAAQCGLFTHKSVLVIFEPPCRISKAYLPSGYVRGLLVRLGVLNQKLCNGCTQVSKAYADVCGSSVLVKS
jgi:hypothetical protein